jgi:hypothetical protein
VSRNTVSPKSEHRARRAAVLESAPPEHRTWLKERLAYSNEPTLRDRLEELPARAFNVVVGVLGSASEFARPVVKLRNQLTHRSASQVVGESGTEMLRLTERTSFLLTACLMIDLGFDEAQIIDATRRSRRFRLLTEVFRRRAGGRPGASGR